MAMRKHLDAPGSAAWHARRARCYNAGDASAMLGCHPSGKTRTELLNELHTGIERQFSDYVQERVLDPGHRVEALWRPLAEEIIGEDLQVYGGSLDVGLSRPLGASLDAITFMEDTLGECKSANDALRAALPHTGRDSAERNDARLLPKGYRVQCEQQQLVTGAVRTLFSACRFNDAGEVVEERHCWYVSDPALRAEILAGWRQFDSDLAAYVAPAAAGPAVVAAPVQALPAVSVVVDGTIAIRHNLPAFEQALRDFLEHRLIREPKTDQDFADLDVQIKAMKGAEAALESAESNWIAQLDAVSTAKRKKDMLAKLVRDNRLMAEKLLASEKERRKSEIVVAGSGALLQHIAALNKRLGKNYMPEVPADFGGCIRGMKSLASMEDKVATELARAKIAATQIADNIDANMKALRELAAGYEFLFADERQVVSAEPDHCRLLIRSRIDNHKAAEERRAAELAERERARIRAEEEARAAAKLRAEQEALEAEERQQRESAQEAQRQQAAAQVEQERQADLQRHRTEANAAGSAVIPMPTRAPAAPAGPPTLRLGQINERLGFTVTADFLASLGYPLAGTDKAAKLWHESSWKGICAAIAQHVVTAANQQKAA